MASKELENEIENLKSDIKAHVFTYQSMTEQWKHCEKSIDDHMRAIEHHRQPDKTLVDALEEICGTTCVDGYGAVIEIANAALGKHKENG